VRPTRRCSSWSSLWRSCSGLCRRSRWAGGCGLRNFGVGLCQGTARALRGPPSREPQTHAPHAQAGLGSRVWGSGLLAYQALSPEMSPPRAGSGAAATGAGAPPPAAPGGGPPHSEPPAKRGRQPAARGGGAAAARPAAAGRARGSSPPGGGGRGGGGGGGAHGRASLNVRPRAHEEGTGGRCCARGFVLRAGHAS
jgi:hypothetical protein